jgi:hypothetical protein
VGQYVPVVSSLAPDALTSARSRAINAACPVVRICRLVAVADRVRVGIDDERHAAECRAEVVIRV